MIIVQTGGGDQRGKRFDRIIAVATLTSSIALAGASAMLALDSLKITDNFNRWQIETAHKNEAQAKLGGREAKQQACVQMALNAVGIISANKTDITDKVASAISALDAACLAVDIDVRALVVSVAEKAKRTVQVQAQRPKETSGPAAKAPSEATIVRLTDRFYLGEPRKSGFDIRGVGPRVERVTTEEVDKTIAKSSDKLVTPAPDAAVGVGVDWNSPFGPFRIDIAKTLAKPAGDDTKLVTFNVGTQF